MKLYMVMLVVVLGISDNWVQAMWCCTRPRKEAPHTGKKILMEIDDRLLLAAMKNDSAECSKILEIALPSQKVAMLNLFNDQGMTPLHLACANNNTELAIAFLITGSPINSRDRFKRTPLYYAAMVGNETLVHRLIEYGAMADLAGEQSPLWAAINRGHLNVITILLAIDGPFKDIFCSTHKHHQIQNTMCTICKEFLFNGSNPVFSFHGQVIGFKKCTDQVHLLCFHNWVYINNKVCCPVCKKL